MPDNVYQQFLEAQKAMFEEWRGYMRGAFQNAGADSDPAGAYAKILETPQDFWKKAEESYKSYQAVFELWKRLSESAEGLNNEKTLHVYDEWAKNHFSLIRNNLIPHLPGRFKDFTEKFVANLEGSGGAMNDYLKSWAVSGDSLQEAFYNSLGNGPQGYIDFLGTWQQNYDNTFGKLANSPTFGRDMDFWKQQKASLDRFIKYNIAVNKFYASIFDVVENATRQAVEDYAAMSAKGTQPKSFEEFYKHWSRLVSDAYQKVLLSDEMSELAGNMVNEMSRFKIEHDKLCEIYLKHVPVPKKSEMDELYETVHELKRELRALKEEIRKK